MHFVLINKIIPLCWEYIVTVALNTALICLNELYIIIIFISSDYMILITRLSGIIEYLVQIITQVYININNNDKMMFITSNYPILIYLLTDHAKTVHT